MSASDTQTSSALTGLIQFGLEQTLNIAGPMTVDLLKKHFIDHGQALPKAISRANDRTWQAMSIALAGDGFLTKVKDFFLAKADTRGIAAQIKTFVDSNAGSFPNTPPEFRQACLAELTKAKQAGLLSAENLTAEQVVSSHGSFARYSDSKGMIDGAKLAVGRVADGLASSYPKLAELLQKPTPGGPPLVAVAFSFFFSREIETNEELSRRLTHDNLQLLHSSQKAAFQQVFLALEGLGANFDVIFEQLDRIEVVVGQTHDVVRDIAEKVDQLVAKNNMAQGEVKVQHSFSIRGEDERRLVKDLLAQFRQLSPEEQKQLPDLLNKLGKLQYGSGDFKGATNTFDEVADNVSEASAKAEAHYNAYRAALESKAWDKALAELRQACELDAARFSPFPLYFYQPSRILGAGGFGAAVLCYGSKARKDVVVKTFHADDLERSLLDVFQEAEILKELKHPAIIGVQDWGYADSIHMSRPYIVMDYFPGVTLETYVQQRGTMSEEELILVATQIAEGMLKVHQAPTSKYEQTENQEVVLHRDLKPANIMVRNEGNRWQVKIIDFGLALRQSVIETSVVDQSLRNTLRGESAVGTYDYAPPEQMGKRKDKVAPYSDIFAFGKTCCFALFGTLEVKKRHWRQISEELSDLLEQCTEEDPNDRPQNFQEILTVLESLSPEKQEARRKQQEAEERERQRQEQLRQEKLRQEAEDRQRQAEQERQRQLAEQQRRREEGERELPGMIRRILDRTGNKPTKEDNEAVNQFIKDYGIADETAKQILSNVREEWRRDNPPKPTTPELQSFPLSTNEAQDYQKRWADYYGVPVFTENKLGMKFAFIPPGTFLMGSPENEEGRSFDKTQHQVTLTNGFYVAVTPVTQSQWKAVTGNNPSRFQGDNNPVDSVSWDDCQEFIGKLNDSHKDRSRLGIPKAGKFALLTEAQWEYACRAGTTTEYHAGDGLNALKQAGWCSYDSNWGSAGQTKPVGSFHPNAWGLYDMHGNVYEWCQDWFGDYPNKDIKDPQCAQLEVCRVLRGGSWYDYPADCRSAFRDWVIPDGCNYGYGCRVAFRLD